MYRDEQKDYYAQKLVDSLRFSIIEMPFKCGYCKTHIIKTQSQIIQDYEALRWDRCPNRNIFIDNNRVYPSTPKVLLNQEIPKLYAERYQKAHDILYICLEASAASSRKCLELVLVDVLGAKKVNLFDKLNEVENQISSSLYKQLHYLREIGNFGAHPRKTPIQQNYYLLSQVKLSTAWSCY